MMRKRVFLTILWTTCALSLSAQRTVRLRSTGEEGRYTVDASVNGVGLRTWYTAENWFVSLSSTTYLFLYENGYITPDEVKGFTILKMPDGSSEKAASFVIRELRVDGTLVRDVPAFVLRKQTVPLLIGSPAFQSLGGVRTEEDRILIGEDEPAAVPEAAEPLDSLRQAAQDHLGADEYSQAASCFEALEAQGALNMFTQYQYALVLNMLQRDAGCIAASQDWLSRNEGKSLTMDYWIHKGLGDSHARGGSYEKAVESYGKAVEAYCKLYNTSEKEIGRGNFHDRNLGSTLYSLGRIHAAQGKVAKAERYCSLSAKCGWAPAREFCDKYKIKY